MPVIVSVAKPVMTITSIYTRRCLALVVIVGKLADRRLELYEFLGDLVRVSLRQDSEYGVARLIHV